MLFLNKNKGERIVGIIFFSYDNFKTILVKNQGRQGRVLFSIGNFRLINLRESKK